MDNYTVDPETGCCLWQGFQDDGYPYHLVNGRHFVSARRSHYERQLGPVPEGRKLMMRCGVDGCVNPAHMDALTQQEIQRRNAATKLSLAQAQEIRALAGQLPQRVIAERFGISAGYVNQILRGNVWADGEPVTDYAVHRRSRLSFADAERIRKLAQTVSKTEIAAQYGVSLSAISRIVSGQRWATPPVTTPSQPAGETAELECGAESVTAPKAVTDPWARDDRWDLEWVSVDGRLLDHTHGLTADAADAQAQCWLQERPDAAVAWYRRRGETSVLDRVQTAATRAPAADTSA